MLAYEALTGGPEQCRMVFLAEQLDDTTAVPCGRCDVCAGPWYPAPDAPASAAAGQGGDDARVAALLERVGVPVEPRASWPSGLDRLLGAGAPKGRIPEGERAAEGRVIARMSDLGWAVPLRELLRSDEDGNPVDAVVPERIGARIVEVLKDWDWDQRPAAVVAIPSTTRPQLVGSLAAGIASIGRLEDLGALDLAPGAGPLRGGGNSAFRVADLWERFTVGAELQARLEQLDGAPILLVDDVIDTRWTMAVVARLLRRAGAGPVLPLALAQQA